jgi:hypothetical protein
VCCGEKEGGEKGAEVAGERGELLAIPFGGRFRTLSQQVQDTVFVTVLGRDRTDWWILLFCFEVIMGKISGL